MWKTVLEVFARSDKEAGLRNQSLSSTNYKIIKIHSRKLAELVAIYAETESHVDMKNFEFKQLEIDFDSRSTIDFHFDKKEHL